MSVAVSQPSTSRASIAPAFRFIPGFVALIVLWLAPLPAPPAAQHALAVSLATIIWWATGPLEHATTGVLALALFAVSGTSDLPTIVSGFWNNTTAFLLGALIIGLFVSHTGLAQRLAFSLAARLGKTYSGLLLALVTVDFLLTFLIPSGIARVAVLAAIVAGLVESTGMSRRDPAARGLMLAVTCSASLFDKMVLAGTSSILASGIIERVGGVRISYGFWFLAYVPCVILTIVGAWRLVLWMFPDASRTFDEGDRHFRAALETLGPPSRQERLATTLAAVAIALWLTDFWHRVAPATVALAIGAVAFLPGIGLLRPKDLRALPARTLIFTACALSISAVLSDTGALRLLTGLMVEWMRAVIHGPATAALVLYWTAFAYHLLLGAQNLMVTATLPPVVTFGQSIGFSPEVFGLIWLFGTAGKIFPYQSGVLMVGYSYGYFDGRDLMKIGLLLAILESLILFFLVPIYWPLIGLL